jgi:predicted nucleic acid-binding protein
MKIYLDVCCLNRPFDDQGQSRIRLETEVILAILDECMRGQLTWISSEAVEEEIVRDPEPDRRSNLMHLLRFAAARAIIEPEARTRAEGYCRAGLRPIDGLHLAAAAQAGCDALLTTDDDFVRKVSRINPPPGVLVANPLKWWTERQP